MEDYEPSKWNKLINKLGWCVFYAFTLLSIFGISVDIYNGALDKKEMFLMFILMSIAIFGFLLTRLRFLSAKSDATINSDCKSDLVTKIKYYKWEITIASAAILIIIIFIMYWKAILTACIWGAIGYFCTNK